MKLKSYRACHSIYVVFDGDYIVLSYLATTMLANIEYDVLVDINAKSVAISEHFRGNYIDILYYFNN